MAKRPRTREESLFSAAVLRRSMEQRGAADPDGYRFVYEGVLRDLGLADADVERYLREHGAEVDAALRGGKPPR